MSENDTRPAISENTLPYRLRRDGWWLEGHRTARREAVRAAPKLVLIQGRRDTEEDHCK